MNDLVTRLRKNVKALNRQYQKLKAEYGSGGAFRRKNIKLEREAADEIERLREAIEYAHSEGFEWPSDPLPPLSLEGEPK